MVILILTCRCRRLLSADEKFVVVATLSDIFYYISFISWISVHSATPCFFEGRGAGVDFSSSVGYQHQMINGIFICDKIPFIQQVFFRCISKVLQY